MGLPLPERQAELTADRSYRLLPTGLEIVRDLTVEEWTVVGRRLVEVHNRTTWAIGDWLVYGTGRGDYGETYHTAAAITSRGFESLSQAFRVSEAFPLDQRTVQVPWSFYREALRLLPAERHAALTLAARKEWTRDDFADYIRQRNALDDVAAEVATRVEARDAKKPSSAVLTWHPRQRNHHDVTCPKCGHRFAPRRGEPS